MPLVTTQIEIAAPPAVVRAKFLDFSKLPTYHESGFLKAVGPVKPGTPLEPGVKFDAKLGFDVVILENTPQAFGWRGAVPGLFKGDHYFRFQPSKSSPGNTTFVHEENFTGALSFLAGENFAAKWIGAPDNMRKNFTVFNEDLKKWCEDGSAKT
ncbi:hypothetical protein EG329_004927 [Mollisiaceae sp. DMI_Dod_QoI]|nr:hypothetical protein EG329_004927 [Helotiales sp. DMI_Dod_QoI]